MKKASLKGLSKRFIAIITIIVIIVAAVAIYYLTRPVPKKVITFWHLYTPGTPREQWLLQAIDEFEREHPDVDIEPTYVENEVFKRQIVTAMSAGNPPDIFQNWGGYMYLFRFVMADMVVDLTPYMERESPYIRGVKWKDTFLPGRIAQVTYKGKIYAVPFVVMFEPIIYNKALFEKYGIPEPTDNWTWDDFVEIVQQIKEKAGPDGKYPIALGNRDSWTGLIYIMNFVLRSAGADYLDKSMVDPNVKLNSEAVVKAMEYVQKIVDLDPFQPGWQGMSDTDVVPYMANEITFMEAMGTWLFDQVSALNETTGSNLRVVGWPIIPGSIDTVNIIGGGDAYAIAKTCKYVDEAVAFLQYLTSPTVQKRQLLTPTIQLVPGIKLEYLSLTETERNSIAPGVKRQIELISKATYIGNYWDQGPPPQIGKVSIEIVQPLFSKTMTPQEAANKLEEARQEWLKEAGLVE